MSGGGEQALRRFVQRAGYLPRGFTTKSALICGLDAGNADRHLPDTSWPRTMRLNGSFGCVLDKTLLFHQVLRSWPEHHPVNHALTRRPAGV